jgi:hypothetical protein
MITPKTFWLWFGGIWLAVGVPFLFIGLYFGFQQHTATQRLDAEGKIVEGMVLVKTITSSSSSGSRRNRTPTYTVTFRFLTPAGTMTGESEVTSDTWDLLVEREPIRVTYVPDAPQYYRVEGQVSGWILPAIFTGLGGILTSLGGFIVLRARNLLRTQTRLQREGITATATVSEIRTSSMRINGAPHVAMHYRYQDDRGRSYTGKEYLSLEEAARWKEGDQATVRYDRQKPNRSIWIGHIR